MYVFCAPSNRHRVYSHRSTIVIVMISLITMTAGTVNAREEIASLDALTSSTS